MIALFYLVLSSTLLSSVICQDSDQFPLPLPTELVINQGYAAAMKQLDSKLASSMLILLRINQLSFFRMTLIDNEKREVIVFEVNKAKPKAKATYYAGAMTGSVETSEDLECPFPTDGAKWEFYLRLNMAAGPIEYSCGKKTGTLKTNEASSHLWRNLVRVRLSGEGDFSSLTYVPVEIPSVSTYASQWEVPLPGKTHFRRGDILDMAFKVKGGGHPYFFTLSASGRDDHWLCYVRAPEKVKYYQSPCWIPKSQWYIEQAAGEIKRNIPPYTADSIFHVQILYLGDSYKVYIDSEYSLGVQAQRWDQEAPTRVIYSNGYLEMLWIRFLG